MCVDQNRTTGSGELIRERLKKQQHPNEHTNKLDYAYENIDVENDILRDVAAFKKKLIQLRQLLQEVSD